MAITVSDAITDLSAIMPGDILVVAGVLILSLGFVPKLANAKFAKSLCGGFALASLGLAAISAWFRHDIRASEWSLFTSDSLALGGSQLALMGGMLITLLGWESVRSDRATEYYGCLLLMIAGLVCASAAVDLTSLFLGLELVSIPTTVLLSITRSDNSGREVTLKYFALAAFSSAFFLLGCSYLYGLAGSTSLSAIHRALAADTTAFARVALALALCGLCFRVTAVPFHFYAPDLFDGAALPVAAGLSFIPKLAGFVAIARLLGGPTLNPALGVHAIPMLLVVAGLTMTLGNCLALIQTRMRRLLAYSSIAHSGYLLLAVAALLSSGSKADVLLDYLAVYATMTLAVFAVLAVLESEGASSGDELSRLTGLAKRRPWLATALAIACLSLAGLPFTAGFWAKIQVFVVSLSAARADIRFVAILMAFNAAIAAVYYLSIAMLLVKPIAIQSNAPQSKLLTGPAAACACCTVLTVLWFFVP